MAIADVVTMGYGTFSSVNKIPTLGYTPGEPSEQEPPNESRRLPSRRITARLPERRTTIRLPDR